MSLLDKNQVNDGNNDQKQRMRKSEQNLKHAKVGQPKEVYGGFTNTSSKPKHKKQYASLRTDKKIVCKLKALRNFYGDHNVGITLGRMLDNELPQILTDDKKKIFFDGLVKSYEKSIGDKPNN